MDKKKAVMWVYFPIIFPLKSYKANFLVILNKSIGVFCGCYQHQESVSNKIVARLRNHLLQ